MPEVLVLDPLVKSTIKTTKMATNLRKNKYMGPAGDRPNASSDRNASKAMSESAPPSPNSSETDTSGLKSEILLALKSDISAVIKSELKDALAED